MRVIRKVVIYPNSHFMDLLVYFLSEVWLSWSFAVGSLLPVMIVHFEGCWWMNNFVSILRITSVGKQLRQICQMCKQTVLSFLAPENCLRLDYATPAKVLFRVSFLWQCDSEDLNCIGKKNCDDYHVKLFHHNAEFWDCILSGLLGLNEKAPKLLEIPELKWYIHCINLGFFLPHNNSSIQNIQPIFSNLVLHFFLNRRPFQCKWSCFAMLLHVYCTRSYNVHMFKCAYIYFVFVISPQC